MVRSFTDQLGRQVQINYPPQRIISLVPSQTELLFDLGLQANIVGITKFCNHPASLVKTIAKAGGTKQLNFDTIQNLKPDLIIGNKEENERTQIEALMHSYPVWMSDIATLTGALQMITAVGLITGTQSSADGIVGRILTGFDQFEPLNKPMTVVYLIWQKPFMVAGRGTFIDDMLKRCGFVNAVKQDRYPELSAEDIQNSQADIVLLSSEPYPFNKKHIAQFQALLPDSKVLLVDGEMFSWYGSRLLHAASYFKQLINDIAF
ncbi:cobalamin-binding protein [Mucilaginibacter sp. PPCGB 2223]|uniref:helical backbone metal receptor n=1 Tax=Mucilaginibacter sp. PPCGB 2223 TaxID=1886027 RepID=UPI0008256142|nr:helical backbone metal receptor [Mucilaginibacter sp. PPCGB 2223]OCX53919.1 cobalamin-binding protein [Mucilaginibacter sp. PPCGB 2223]